MAGEPKMNLLERAADALDLPADIVARLPKVEIIGMRRLTIENHKGIKEYTSEKIDVNGGQVVVRVKGKDLTVRSMNASELSLKGLIFSVEFVY